MTNSNIDPNTIAMLVGTVQQLKADMETLLARTPNPDQIWLTSGDFAKLAGTSASTLRAYREANVFQEHSVRAKKRKQRVDYLYHREHALADFRTAQS